MYAQTRMVVPADPGAVVASSRGLVRGLRAISVARGRPFTMEDKPGRFELQKTVYLLKRLGYRPAARYDFNIYLNGPYSPDLAQVYYVLGDEGLERATQDQSISRFIVSTVTDALSRGPDFLEGLTTVVDGIRTMGQPAKALDWAKSIKPHIGAATWQEVKLFLAAHHELT